MTDTIIGIALVVSPLALFVFLLWWYKLPKDFK